MSNEYDIVLQASTESLNNIQESDVFHFDYTLNKTVVKCDTIDNIKSAYESITNKTLDDTDPADEMHKYYSKTFYQKKEYTNANTMCMRNQNNQGGEFYNLYLYSDNGVHIRLYMSEVNAPDLPLYQNKLCYLLNKLDSKKSLDIYLGNGIGGPFPICTVGNIFSALMNCKANVRIHMNGRGSMLESCLWLHGHKKIISPYGSLCFTGVGRLLESYPQWRGYYETIFTKAMNLNLITENDLADLMTTNYIIFIGANDTLAKITRTE